MANWANPTITSNYVNFVDEVKNRDIDAITLQATAVTAPPLYSVRLSRAPIKFQQWSGSAYQDLVLSPEGGGTGVTNIPALVPQLGLGTMATQNHTAVNITGGVIANITLSSSTLINTVMGGSARFSGTGFTFEYYQGYTPINVIGGPNVWSQFITGNNTLNQSLGLLITAGTSKTDNALMIRNQDASKYGLFVRGDMGIICPYGLVIPVGQSAFVPA